MENVCFNATFIFRWNTDFSPFCLLLIALTFEGKSRARRLTGLYDAQLITTRTHTHTHTQHLLPSYMKHMLNVVSSYLCSYKVIVNLTDWVSHLFHYTFVDWRRPDSRQECASGLLVNQRLYSKCWDILNDWFVSWYYSGQRSRNKLDWIKENYFLHFHLNFSLSISILKSPISSSSFYYSLHLTLWQGRLMGFFFASTCVCVGVWVFVCMHPPPPTPPSKTRVCTMTHFFHWMVFI